MVSFPSFHCKTITIYFNIHALHHTSNIGVALDGCGRLEMEAHNMKQFKNILYVSEETVDQGSVVGRAVSMAEHNQARLTVIDVISPVADVNFSDTVNHHKQKLESLIEPYRNRLTIQIDVLVGTIFLEVIRSVLRNAYDLVIKAAEKSDFMNRLFGSVDMHLLRKCPCLGSFCGKNHVDSG